MFFHIPFKVFSFKWTLSPNIIMCSMAHCTSHIILFRSLFEFTDILFCIWYEKSTLFCSRTNTCLSTTFCSSISSAASLNSPCYSFLIITEDYLLRASLHQPIKIFLNPLRPMALLLTKQLVTPVNLCLKTDLKSNSWLVNFFGINLLFLFNFVSLMFV